MTIEKLNDRNAEEYIEYLKQAMSEEPERMTADSVDTQGIKDRISDSFFNNSVSLLAKDGQKVVGRIEYHFYGCIQDGYKMAYVDWVYVLKSYRHRGIARRLFAEFEKDCISNGINQLYLIRATNAEADKFYKSFENAELSDCPLLRKYIK